jgi:hypothetical protein
MNGPSAYLLADGRRLHLQHGPIDLIVEAWGAAEEVRRAYGQAVARFADILAVLVEELPGLRTPIGPAYPLFRGPVARRMAEAVWPHRAVFITPMAAVAGAVADEIMQAMLSNRCLAKAYVNNGGDIALHLSPGESFAAGIVADQDHPLIDAVARIDAADPVRGVATSGWRGRSQSLGIADAASVLAATAAGADAAATLVANAVNVDHPAVRRRPARELRDDSDLGDLPVTVAVGPLPEAAVAAALDAGVATAAAMRRRGLIEAAFLALQGQVRTVGAAATALPAAEVRAWS